MVTELNFVKIVFTTFGKPKSKFHVSTRVLSVSDSGLGFGHRTWNLDLGLPKGEKKFLTKLNSVKGCKVTKK